MKRKTLTGMLLLFFTSFLSLNAQWAITYGGSESDTASSFLQTEDGGYIVAGETRSFGAGWKAIWILKLSSDGDIEWQKTYGGSDGEEAHSIQQTRDGGYIVRGSTYSFGDEDGDIWILKLSSAGDIEWQKTYGGSEGEEAHSIQQTRDGGYIVRGSIASSEEGQWDQDIWVLKLSSDGDIEWQKTYGGDKSDSASFLQQGDDGGYIVVGHTESFGAGGDDIWILKLSLDGEIEWQKTYGGSEDEEANSFQQTDDGGYIVAGKTSSFGAGGDDIWILKLSSDGDIEWQRTYGGSDSDYARSIQQTSDGGYIVAGSTSIYGEWGGNSEQNIWILKLSSTGVIEWKRAYGGSESDTASSFLQTNDGGHIIVGETSSSGAESYDIWILKLSSEGDIEWKKTYGGSYSYDVAHSIQQTSDGGYIVPGETRSWGDNGEIWVLKLLPNGDINPRCAFIKSSNAEVSDTDITPEDTDITPEDTNITPEDTDISPEDTDISPEDSDANVYKLGVSDMCTLTLSKTSGGTTSPTPGTYTYSTGTEVTLKATPTPDSEYVFGSWSGNVGTSTNPITITIDGDKSINASFYIPGAGEWGGGSRDRGCFIATAAYNSPLHPHVKILRDFRDKYLMQNKFGRKLVNFYYKYSPFVADFITKHKALKVVVRKSLLPIVAFSFMLLHLGPAITGVLLIFIFGLPFFLFWYHKRKLKYK